MMKFANEVASLMHYMHAVVELAHTDVDWLSYDKEFRVTWVTQPRPWHEINGELCTAYRLHKPKPKRLKHTLSTEVGK